MSMTTARPGPVRVPVLLSQSVTALINGLEQSWAS
jgi:hypothetical protein